MGNDIHFRCKECGNDRDIKRELSHFSKQALAAAPANLKKKDRAELLLCKYCVNNGITNFRNLPKPIQDRIAKSVYWEKRVTDEELKSPHPDPEPVVHDRLMTYKEAADISGVAYGTVTYWVSQGLVKSEQVDGGKRIRESVLLEHLQKREEAGHNHEAREKPAKGSKDTTLNPNKALDRMAMALGDKRREQKLKLDDVADKIGVSSSTLSQLESGQRQWVQPKTYNAVRRFLGKGKYNPDNYAPNAESSLKAVASEAASAPEPTMYDKVMEVTKQAVEQTVVPSTNGHKDKVVVVNTVVDAELTEALKKMAPWEASALQEKFEGVDSRLKDLEGQVKSLEDATAAKDIELDVYRAWIDTYRSQFPDWPGWAQLDADISQAKTLEGDLTPVT